MPTLTLALDYAGRPIIELYVGVSAAAQAALFAGKPRPAVMALRALIDTGTSRTVVEEGFLVELGLDETGAAWLRSATTGAQPVLAKRYAVSLALAEDVTGVLAADLEVIAAESLGALGVQALLGRDVLNSCILLYDGPGRIVSLTVPPFEQP